MQELTYILPWVLASVTIGILVGFYISRAHVRHVGDDSANQREREATLKVLVELLRTAEQMTSNVECHNSEIRRTSQDVESLPANGEMELIKEALLGKVERLLSSNQRLQSDLMCSRYQMEEQAQQLDHARREARTDVLTSVANRKAFDEKLHVLMTTWKRQGQPFVLMLIDLDHFKRINDSHGHPVGDHVLAMVGSWLKGWVREGDFVGRYGGDEFAILLPQTELDIGLERAEFIRARTAEQTLRTSVRGELISVSLSIGVAMPADADSRESLLARADQALYQSKQSGRNKVRAQRNDGSLQACSA